MGYAGVRTRDGSIVAPDDVPVYIGTDLDQVLVNRSTSLTANTALTNVLIGTPVIAAIAANSLIISNTIASGDIVIAGNRGGNSESYLFADVSAGDLFLDARGPGNIQLRTSATNRLYIGASNGFLVFNGAVTAPTSGTDEVRLAQVDFAAGDARLYLRAESGGTTVFGNNAIRQLTDDLTLSTAGTNTDITLTPTRAVVISLGATRIAVADAVSYFVADIAAGDARIGFQAELGAITYLGNNEIRHLGDLTIVTTVAGSDLQLDPDRAVVVLAGSTRVAVADQTSYFVVDIAAGDARIGFQAELGSIIYLGNDILRFAAATGIIGIGATSVISTTSTLLTVPIDILVSVGIRVGADSTNNEIDDASQGAATTTLYIGNASINVTSDMRLKKNILDWGGSALRLLRQARVVDYDWDDPSDRNPYGKAVRGRYVGMLAQETIEWAPWVINAEDRLCPTCKAGRRCTRHTSFWFVEYEHMVPLLVKGLQEVDQRLSTIENLIRTRQLDAA